MNFILQIKIFFVPLRHLFEKENNITYDTRNQIQKFPLLPR